LDACDKATIENQDDSELSQEMEVYPLVFSELLTYIVETKTSSDNPVIFCLADLVGLYKQRLEQLGMKTHSLHEMFQQMRIYDQSCVLARSWQLLASE
jgi:hypothetical protein